MEKETKLYEIGYLINPGISEEQVAEEVNSIRNTIERNDGVVSLEEKAKLIKLAYTIKKIRVGKFETAFWGWIKFMAEPEKIKDIKDETSKMPNIIRLLIITGSNEQPQAKLVKRTYTKKEEKLEEKQEVITAEVDKKIEELVGS